MMNGRPVKSHDPRRGPLRGLRAWLGAIFYSKPFLFVVSLLVSVLFWGVLVASDGTLTRLKTFPSVPVSVTGEAALQSRGYIVMDDIAEMIPSVKMTAEVAQANYSRITGSTYNPHVDLTDVEGEGENELKVSFTSQLYGPVVSCEPESITVRVERFISRRVPVVLEPVGETSEGIYLDVTRLDPTVLTVAGPQSLVSSVSRAVARLDLSTLSPERMSDKASLDVELQDASGEPVTSSRLQITNQSVLTDTITVETELVPVRDIPVDVESLVTGEPAQGYELVGVEAANESLSVAALQENLDAITSLTTDQPLDITGATADVTGTVRLRRPAAAENVLPTELSVTAHIHQKMLERTLKNLPVEVRGLDETAYRAVLSSSTLSATLTGSYLYVKALQAEDISLYVDVSGLGEGEHTLPVQMHADGAADLTCELSEREIHVTLYAQ